MLLAGFGDRGHKIRNDIREICGSGDAPHLCDQVDQSDYRISLFLYEGRGWLSEQVVGCRRGIQCEKPGGTELLKVVWNIPVPLGPLCLWAVCRAEPGGGNG